MPRRCSVFGCRSNYDGENEFVTTFSLPKSEPLRSKWLRSIPTDISKLKNAAVCLKHFSESSILRADVIIKNGERKEFPRKIPKLIEGTIPTIFPNTPKYLSNNASTSRRLADAEDERFEQTILESLKEYKEYKEKDTINSLSDIVKYITEKKDLRNWVHLLAEDKIFLLHVSIKDDFPSVLGTIIITQTLEVTVVIKKMKIEKSKYLGSANEFNSFNVLDHVLNFVESNCREDPPDIDELAHVIEIIKQHKEFTDSSHLQFIVEQLKLIKVSKEGRRYSNNTMIFASTLYVYSPSAYNAVRKSGFLFMPHPRNLQKLISTIHLDDSMNLDGSTKYLMSRMKYLDEHEKIINLHLDEIYIQQEINFKGKGLYGVSSLDASEAAKTAQVFMISSCFSKYRDVVCIFPVNKLEGEPLHKMTTNVITAIEKIGFKVIAAIADNNSVNRKAFELFFDDKVLQSSTQHPLDPSRKLFFLFDTVHIIKCVRNNWECKKDGERKIIFPSFTDFTTLFSASFKDLETLYHLEKKSLLKFGHLLSYKVLYPSNIQKQNVNLALKLFSEKNIVALQQVSEEKPHEFKHVEGTSEFLGIFVQWWKTVNVKSVYEAKRFNDPHREAITSENDDQMQFLMKFTSWLQAWKSSVTFSDALTSQTFNAIYHTTKTFLELVPYLFNTYKVNYVLLSKFQNDTIESRFSSYRQLSGSNYYISLVQLLENERKIRFRNFVIISTKNENIRLKTMLPCEDDISQVVDISPYRDILSHNFFLEVVPKDTLKLLAFIGGYSIRGIIRKDSCELCISWLQLNEEVEMDIPEEEYKYIQSLSRGKLMLPTNYVITAMGIVWYVMKNILECFRDEFTKDHAQLSIVHNLCCIFISRLRNFPLGEQCLCYTTLQSKLETVALTGCKILINNFVKSFKDEQLAKKKSLSDERKLKKLKKS